MAKQKIYSYDIDPMELLYYERKACRKKAFEGKKKKRGMQRNVHKHVKTEHLQGNWKNNLAEAM